MHLRDKLIWWTKADAECDSELRNGYVRTLGLVLSVFGRRPNGQTIWIKALNSRGMASRGHIELPLSVVPQLIKELQELAADLPPATPEPADGQSGPRLKLRP